MELKLNKRFLCNYKEKAKQIIFFQKIIELVINTILFLHKKEQTYE